MQTVELAVQVVAPDERGEPILEEVLLEPSLVELPARRRVEIADALCVADEAARMPAVRGETAEDQSRAPPAQQSLSVERELEA